jgi:ribonuclease E
LNDQIAEAVETKPPTARTRAPRKSRASASTEEGKASTEAPAAPPQADAKPAEATSAGGSEAPEKPKPARAPRSRARKPKAATEPSVEAASESTEPAPAAEPVKEAPTAPFAERRSRTPRKTKAQAAAEAAGESAPAPTPAAESSNQPAEAAAQPAIEDAGGESKPARPRRRRSRSSGAAAADAEAASGSEAQASEAPAAPAAPAADAVSDQAESPASEGDEQSGNAPTTARTRNRRRRSRSRGGGSGSDQASRPNGAEPASDSAASADSNGSAAAAATVPATAPQTERQGGDRQGDRQSSGDRSRGGRKRRSSRRPRLEQIVPLGPRKMLVSTGKDRSQIAVLEGRELIEHYVAKDEDQSIVGNIYIGRVENVLPGMEAAFLDIGEARNAVLYVGEVSYEEDLEGPPPRIESLLKSGQAVVAQVTKDPMGSKGARLTTEVSLAGRYLVLVPNADSLGISRRLADNERRRLRDIASRIRPDGHGMIVRTAANGASEEDLERDVARLTRIWNEVSERIDGSKPPKLIYSEPPLAIRVVRDLFTADVEQVIVDSEESYHQVKDYLEEVAPDFGDRVELYADPMPLFERYHVMEQVRKAVDRKVWLSSGGHIVIDRTEAMTVIDVNTGRFVGRSTLEDTVLHANLEAAEEIAKQLRLRDIGGIIVIDFIDMGYERNREELLRTFERALLRDKTRTQVYGVSELGLVQMTRKRVSEGLLEAYSTKCEVCDGRGVVLNDMS